MRILFLTLMTALLPLCGGYYLVHVTMTFVKGICPNGRCGSIGKYRRNFITFERNFTLLKCWGAFAVVLAVWIYLGQWSVMAQEGNQPSTLLIQGTLFPRRDKKGLY